MVNSMNERISALMDGELSSQEEASVLQWLRHNPDGAEQWHTYHLIRDALREKGAADVDVRSRVMAQLEAEPTILAPRRARMPARRTMVALSAAASVAAVSVVGWMGWHTRPTPANAPTMQAAVTAPLKATGTADMRPYLAAHQQFSGQVNGRSEVRPANYEGGEPVNK